MKKEKLEDVKKTPVNADKDIDSVKFISTDEDEKEGNFEFLCCRGGSMTGNSRGGGGRW
ncbi:hypothetical protein SD961_17725 [Erwinia sp. MMLR14_017]|uniref:hypothetical protein n=1 Tax=Erwinia sp. MMLR14_017 TaxID=3093842 RepID=UPI00298FCFB2|nr:hypothetical protein [Erwinia sp. MMLR14_017]MDW8847703.1 hypothetical protein [Erwinia sp. MMLR14_017]